MLRRDLFLENNLFYDGKFAAEDYELWTRVLSYGNIENIPMVLGYYRDDGHSITEQKKEILIMQHSEIVSSFLKRSLGMELSKLQKRYFLGWINPFDDVRSGIHPGEREFAKNDLKQLFTSILDKNLEVGFFDQDSLRRTVAAEWASLCYHLPYCLPENDKIVEDIFQKRDGIEVFIKKGVYFTQKYLGFRRKK